MKDILHVYGDASGQEVNFSKYEVYFSSNAGEELKNNIATTLGVNVALGKGIMDYIKAIPLSTVFFSNPRLEHETLG